MVQTVADNVALGWESRQHNHRMSLEFLHKITSDKHLLLQLDSGLARHVAALLALDHDVVERFAAIFEPYTKLSTIGSFRELCAHFCAACKQYNNRALLDQLPNELLLEIFQHVLDSEHEISPYTRLVSGIASSSTCSTLPIPFLLSSVCSRWRQVVLGAHKLWTECSLLLKSEQSFSRILPALELAALRSGHGPMDLSIYVPRERLRTMALSELFPCSIARPHPDLGSLYQCAVRLNARSIDIEVPDTFAYPLFALKAPLWTELESLKIVLRSPFLSWDTYANGITAFVDVPKLRRVHLISNCHGTEDSLLSRIALPWSQLTHLTLREASSEINPSTIRAMFRSCAPSLEYCEIQMRGWHWDEAYDVLAQDASDTSIIVFPHLKELFLDFNEFTHRDDPMEDDMTMMSPMLSNVAFPVLKSLRLWTTLTHYLDQPRFKDQTLPQAQWEDLGLLDLQRRSGFALESFQLNYAACSGTQLVEFLKRVPTLKTLDIRRTFNIWEDVLEELSSPSGPLFLPNLENLLIDEQDDCDVSTEAYVTQAALLLHAVTIRCSPISTSIGCSDGFSKRLRRVVFSVARNPDYTHDDGSPRELLPQNVMSQLRELKTRWHPEVQILIAPGVVHLQDFDWWRRDLGQNVREFDHDAGDARDEDEIYDDEDVQIL